MFILKLKIFFILCFLLALASDSVADPVADPVADSLLENETTPRSSFIENNLFFARNQLTTDNLCPPNETSKKDEEINQLFLKMRSICLNPRTLNQEKEQELIQVLLNLWKHSKSNVSVSVCPIIESLDIVIEPDRLFNIPHSMVPLDTILTSPALEHSLTQFISYAAEAYKIPDMISIVENLPLDLKQIYWGLQCVFGESLITSNSPSYIFSLLFFLDSPLPENGVFVPRFLLEMEVNTLASETHSICFEEISLSEKRKKAIKQLNRFRRYANFHNSPQVMLGVASNYLAVIHELLSPANLYNLQRDLPKEEERLFFQEQVWTPQELLTLPANLYNLQKDLPQEEEGLFFQEQVWTIQELLNLNDENHLLFSHELFEERTRETFLQWPFPKWVTHIIETLKCLNGNQKSN